MTDLLSAAVAALQAKLDGGAFDGSAKFVIAGKGALMLDAAGVRASDEAAEVTLTADAGTFQDLLGGRLSPASAFLSGRLKIDGDMGTAMRLGSVLA